MTSWLTVLAAAVLLASSASALGEKTVGGSVPGAKCLGSAGYEWCDEFSRCVRRWEEHCPSLGGN